MAGTIDEIPLPDLIQLLSTSKKSGVLEIQTEGYTGRIYLRVGQIYYATLNDSFDIGARKAIYRMLIWESGSFELHPPDDKEFLDELDEPTEGLLMDAMRQLDEIKRLEPELPPASSHLRLAQPIESPLRDLPSEQLDVLQLIHNYGQLSTVVDRSPASDLDNYLAILDLLKANIVELTEE